MFKDLLLYGMSILIGYVGYILEVDVFKELLLCGMSVLLGIGIGLSVNLEAYLKEDEADDKQETGSSEECSEQK